MTEIFIKGFLVIGIASAVLCAILAMIELVRIFLGKDDE